MSDESATYIPHAEQTIGECPLCGRTDMLHYDARFGYKACLSCIVADEY